MVIEIDGIKISIVFSDKNIQIKNSYQIKTTAMKKKILRKLMNSCNYIVGHYKRSFNSYLFEWKAHNYLYNKGYKRERTGSVDFSENESKLRRICYFF